MFMSKKLAKVAAILLAFALALSCSSDNNGGNDPSPQPLPGLPSSSDNGGNGDVSSSSITSGDGSSSSATSDGSSSSVTGGGESSSSSITGSGNSSSSVGGGSYTEKGNNIANYRTAQIGNKLWLAENLDYYVDGSKCYGDDTANCAIYGRLYDWATAMGIDTKYNDEKWGGSDENHQGICPSGWHIPSSDEWTTMVNLVGNGSNSTSGIKLKAESGWDNKSDGTSGNGTDDVHFSALPGGTYNSTFRNLGISGSWLSAYEPQSTNPTYTAVWNIRNSFDYAGRNEAKKSNFFSVRCVKD